MDIETLKQYGIQIDSFSYRGFEVPFYEDVHGHQIVAIWEDQLIEFGYYNTAYREDMKLFIDEKLDTITRFGENPKLYGSKLEYFQNKAFRDIRLLYRGRILKIWLDPAEMDLEAIQTEALYLILNEVTRRSSDETNT